MVQVYVRHGNFYKAFAIFKREVQKEGILKELKIKRFYEKPSEKRKRKLTESLRRQKKVLRKEQLFQEKRESNRNNRWKKGPLKKFTYRLNPRD